MAISSGRSVARSRASSPNFRRMRRDSLKRIGDSAPSKKRSFSSRWSLASLSRIGRSSRGTDGRFRRGRGRRARTYESTGNASIAR